MSYAFSFPPSSQTRRDLRTTVTECAERGLYAGSKWASEMLCSMPEEDMSDGEENAGGPSSERTTKRATLISPSSEEDKYQLGKAYYDMKELERAAFVLRGCEGSKGRFLGLYCRYLASEKGMIEKRETVMGPKDNRRVVNPELGGLLEDLKSCDDDPYLLYLKAIIQYKLHKPLPSLSSLIASLSLNPFFWSAWLHLSTSLHSPAELSSVIEFLPQNCWVTECFLLHVGLELHLANEGMEKSVEKLGEVFRDSLWLGGIRGGILYHLRDFETAETQFEQLLTIDPHRVEDLDIYSNILYVMEKRSKLSSLVSSFLPIASHRPEVCCLTGNYYSLLGLHTKSIASFRRALSLDANYLSAWTLLGHEYVEMKNSHAAIECYRRAVDVNRKDYRAWYGLGQTYEILEMPWYAIHYYSKAVGLRPDDARMWLALVSCYELLSNTSSAIKCLVRALGCSEEGDLNLIHRLAGLYEGAGEGGEAAGMYRRMVEVGAGDARVTMALMWLAKWEIQRGNSALATSYLNKIGNGVEREEAEAMLRTLRLSVVG